MNSSPPKSQSIWDYPQVLETPLPITQLTLNEGHTPLVQIENIYFKREDLNPTGSIKDRGISYQMSSLVSQGVKNFTVSSSGNAAISAGHYAKQANAQLTCFVSPNIDPHKQKLLESVETKIIVDQRAISSAHRYAKSHQMYNLRPSQDPQGTIGYRTIAIELIKDIGNVDFDLFLSVSSGTTLVGIFEGFQILGQGFPRFWCVQTSHIHPIASHFDKNFHRENSSLASGIVSKSVPRKSQILAMLQQTQGGGVIVDNQQIQTSHEWLVTHDISTGFESASALAGYRKNSFPKNRRTVILLTGADRS